MEIPQIDEIRLDARVEQSNERVEVKATEAEKKKCVYLKDTTCQAPDCKMEICGKCPYGKAYSFSSTVKDVFSKIISMAIFLAKSDDVLRDVMVLIAKGNVENNGKEELGELEVKEGKEAKEVEEVGKGEGGEGKGIENTVEPRPIIKPISMNDVKVEALSAQKIMAKIIINKVADISEALGPRLRSGQANPNGPEKPLV